MTLKQERLAEAAAPELGEALADHVLAREEAEPGDREHRRYLLNDLNDLLGSACGAGSELHSSMLNDPTQLRGHLMASMDLPAQTLAKALPNRLQKWLDQRPPPNHPARPQWAEEGRFLLDQARMSPSHMA